jgi:hypothetical protein
VAVTALPFLFSGAGPVSNSLLSPAKPTSPAEAANLNTLQVELPRTKAEAAAFDRQHTSPYNFSWVKSMNAAYSGGDTLTMNRLQNASQVSSASTPAASSNAALTPAPTQAGPVSNSAALTPTPTSSSGRSLKPMGIPVCTTNPGGSSPDACEPDNNLNNATLILPNDPTPQWHNFFITTTTTGCFPLVTPATLTDTDYLRFNATASVTYTVVLTQVTSSPSSPVPSLLLFDGNGTQLANGFVSGSTSTIANYTTTSNNTLYIFVQPNPGYDCTIDTYQISLLSGPVPTATPTSTVAGSPSPTLVPCRDAYENDDTPGNAKLLKPSISDQPPFAGTPGQPAVTAQPPAPLTLNPLGAQSHYICPQGDVDWVYMDLVKGKNYSIFTTGLSDGLDTFIVLYLKDTAGNLVPLYSSDDYPGMGMASRIDWIVPTNIDTPLGETARYYLAVKDVAGHGDLNLQYNLYLTTPGNGLGDCFDQYEPNNNPTQAKEILLNEQQSHSFCPTGDHDWVRFYAKAGRSYNMSTNSVVNGVVGLDPSLYIWQVSFAPDDPTTVTDQRLLAQNDDKDNTDLNSSVTFAVPTDGYYYAEVRNAGDIGRNGMYYNLRFATSASAAVPQPTTVTAATSTPTLSGATQTVIAAQTATAAAATTTVSSSGPIEALLSKLRFGDASFQRLWVFSDLPVAAGRTQRSWEWGPQPLVNKLEEYAEASGGQRQVQYFDKSRMEINNPKGDRNSRWYVTNGLLVKELVTGWMATGDTKAELHPAASIPVAGDLSDTNKAPTYAALLNLITVNGANRASDQSGKVVNGFVARDGTLSTLKTPPEQVKFAAYVKETGHNIPSVFWSYLNDKGLVFDGTDYKQDQQLRDWVFSMGLPLSEPFWVKAQVNGQEKDVLVQLFERRVLTYTPSNTPEWRVEMSNVGQHYYLWRYNAKLE